MAVTTPKDAVRLSPDLRLRVMITGVDLEWEDPRGIDGLLDNLLSGPRPPMRT